MQVKVDISPNWKKHYGIDTLNGELNYINEVESSLCYFELKKIKFVQNEVLKRLMVEKDIARIAALQKKQMELNTTEAEIVKKIGTVIIKQLKPNHG
jgi:DNA primase